MRFFVIFFSLGILLVSYTNLFGQIIISEIRKSYPLAVEDEEICEELYDKFEAYKKELSPVLMGYKGSISALMSKHSYNPFSKFFMVIEQFNILLVIPKIFFW